MNLSHDVLSHTEDSIFIAALVVIYNTTIEYICIRFKMASAYIPKILKDRQNQQIHIRRIHLELARVE